MAREGEEEEGEREGRRGGGEGEEGGAKRKFVTRPLSFLSLMRLISIFCSDM